MTRTSSEAPTTVADRFVAALKKLGHSELLLLRGSTGRPLGQDPAACDLFHAIWRPLRAKPPFPKKWASWLVAILYPWQPQPGGRGSLGAALRRAAAKVSDRRVRPRLEQLLAAGSGPPDRELAAAIRLLANANVPVDWRRLLADLGHWYDTDRPVQRHWAEDYTRSEKGESHAH